MSATTELHTNPEVQETENKLPTVQITPRIDLLEHEDHFVMSIDAPGVDKEHLDVTLEKNVLTIEGTSEFQIPEGYELVSGRKANRKYVRSFRLSDEIDSEGIDVEVKDGLVKLHFPKSQKAQKVKLTVKEG